MWLQCTRTERDRCSRLLFSCRPSASAAIPPLPILLPCKRDVSVPFVPASRRVQTCLNLQHRKGGVRLQRLPQQPRAWSANVAALQLCECSSIICAFSCGLTSKSNILRVLLCASASAISRIPDVGPTELDCVSRQYMLPLQLVM